MDRKGLNSLGAAFAAAAWLGAAGQAQAAPVAADDVRRIFHRDHAARLVPLLLEVIRFPTVAGDSAALGAQKAWLARVGGELGLVVREAGPITEIDLPGPPGAPVLGLLVHGDVQPVAEAEWSVPPFAGVEKDGFVWGRGAADDKGPLVQALLAMRALADSGAPRTHTVRLLVGSDEESTGEDLKTYLLDHRPPELSLVLDSSFPAVVGEKAWNALTVTVASPFAARETPTASSWDVKALAAGISDSIVPSRATATLRWRAESREGMAAAVAALAAKRADGLTLEVVADVRDARTVTLVAHGRAAHAGMNLEGGRNALVFLARALDGSLAPSGAANLLSFAILAGEDLYGTGLGLTAVDPLWGRYAVNVATVRPADGGGLALTINLRRTPPLTGRELRSRLEALVAEWNARHGAHLVASGFYDDEPFALDPDSAIVRRLLAAYGRATGTVARPAISGGSTYAKRLPHAIAFGMWFPGQPYPGHDVDERIAVADLLRGTDVLIEALTDLATSPPVAPPERLESRRAAAPGGAAASASVSPAAQTEKRAAPAGAAMERTTAPAGAAMETTTASTGTTIESTTIETTAPAGSAIETSLFRADTHSFVFTRGSTEHSSALYGGMALGRRGGAFLALVKNPMNGYHEALGGLFTNLAVGKVDASLALAYADASDGKYVQLYVSPSFSTATWSLSGTLEVYSPWAGDGLRQLYLDPISFLHRAGSRWDVGASYTLGVSEGDAPRHRLGPAAQLALPTGSVRAEVLHDFHDASNDLRLIYTAGF